MMSFFLLEFCNVVSYLDLDPWFLVDYKAPKSLERREDKFHVAVVLLDLLTRVLHCMFRNYSLSIGSESMSVQHRCLQIDCCFLYKVASH